jgi:hypothetical protein
MSAHIFACGVRVRSRMTMRSTVRALPGADWKSLRLTCARRGRVSVARMSALLCGAGACSEMLKSAMRAGSPCG